MSKDDDDESEHCDYLQLLQKSDQLKHLVHYRYRTLIDSISDRETVHGLYWLLNRQKKIPKILIVLFQLLHKRRNKVHNFK